MPEQTPTAWLGRQEECEDALDPALAKRVAATFSQAIPSQREALPALWHWAFFQAPLPPAELGRDGHPIRGGFLPPAGERNRMWAGGRVDFRQPLCVGINARRESEIAAIEEKQGRSGALLFVTVCHKYWQQGELCIVEEQDIVYREPAPLRPISPQPMPHSEWSERIEPTPTLLFRYSAITFNGHRIHYDWPYATQTEGYSGLVVHGPMIATLLVRAFQKANPAAQPTYLSYRGLRPLTAPQPFEVSGRRVASGQAELWAGNADGPAQQGELHFEEVS